MAAKEAATSVFKNASVEIGRVCARQCAAERMHGHALTAKMRVERYAS